MKETPYKLGIYFNRWTIRQQQFGVGLIWQTEKYVHINLFSFELAIGYTAR
mgnify:CR=1 FL=1